MESDAITLDVLSNGRIICGLRSPKGRLVAIDVSPETAEPKITGDEVLTRNNIVVGNLLMAIGAHQRSLDENLLPEERKQAAKEAKALSLTSEYVAELSDYLFGETVQAWCSHCLMFSILHKVDRPGLQRRAYLCDACGMALTHCVVPGCESMAIRTKELKNTIAYCAEHRHDIPSFERAADKIADITNFRSLMTYDKRNVARNSKHIATTVALAGTGAAVFFVTAPAIGGVIGVKMLGLKGAAATSAGLAKLGGGSLAAGGLGMAGGTAILTTTGSVLGGAYGARFLSGYLNEDKSFSIEKLRDGTGPSVIIARGFTTEKNTDWRDEVRFAELNHDDPTIYQLTWGAKELKDLAALPVLGGAGGVGVNTLRGLAASASRKAAKTLGPIGAVVGALDLVRNPWHVAVSRAERAGWALAEILSRNSQDDWVLIGHSLGARVMAHAALGLAEKPGAPRIRTIYLFGAAISTNDSWHQLAGAASESIHNYHSRRDAVLKFLYTTVQGGRRAVGNTGFITSNPTIVNHDVSELVEDHTEYFRKITTNNTAEMAE